MSLLERVVDPMAYLNYLAFVSVEQVEAFGQNRANSFRPSCSVVCSHLTAYSVSVQPLGELLGEAIDGGEVLEKNPKHPFRQPKVHSLDSVAKLSPLLKGAWAVVLLEEPMPEDDWYRLEIEKVVQIFDWAYSHKECVVSFLPSPVEPGAS